MSTPVYPITWPQGEDFLLEFLWKEGPDGSETAVDLTGHTVRMDLQNPITKTSVLSLESTDPNEITFGTGSEQGWIFISIPRSVSLPGGVIGDALEGTSPVTVYNYDIFVRRPSGTQEKLLRGKVVIEPSFTLWA